MKNWLAGVGLVACLALFAFGRSNPSTSSSNMTENDFRKLEQNWLDAASTPDLPALRKMMADDFMGTAFGGDVLSKSDVVPPDGVNANHMPKSQLRDATVRQFGDTAVLMGTVEVQGAPDAGTLRMTTVFQKRGEDWKVIAVHMSKSPA
jgi:ketosteroid isomerase-like protein